MLFDTDARVLTCAARTRFPVAGQLRRWGLRKKMNRTVTALVAMCCVAGCYSAKSQSTNNTETLIPPAQSELMPTVGTKYQIVIPPTIYQTTEPGPKEIESEKAWRLGNEFVFRTALRKGVTMPAIGVIHITNDVFLVRFLTPKGKDAGFLFVHTGSNEAEISE